MPEKYDRRVGNFASVERIGEGEKSKMRVGILQLGEMSSSVNLTENGEKLEIDFRICWS